jgi:hypothetical protein
MTFDEFWSRLRAAYQHRFYPKAFAELTRDVTVMSRIAWADGRRGEDRVIPAGMTVRVTMASRFGDVGFIDDLTASTGYVRRTGPDEGLLTNFRIEGLS